MLFHQRQHVLSLGEDYRILELKDWLQLGRKLTLKKRSSFHFRSQDTSDRKANHGRLASVKMGTSYATYFITSSPSCGRFKNSGHVLKKYGILIKKRRKALKILKYFHIEKNNRKGKYKKKR